MPKSKTTMEIEHSARTREAAIRDKAPQFHAALVKIEAKLKGNNNTATDVYKIAADALALVPVQLTR